MVCNNCNNVVDDTALFCNKCGNKLNDTFPSKSITENTTHMQQNANSIDLSLETQEIENNENNSVLQDFLNEEITDSSPRISSLLQEDDKKEEFLDDISLEDTKEIEIPKNVVAIDLNSSEDEVCPIQSDSMPLLSDEFTDEDINPSIMRNIDSEDLNEENNSPHSDFKIPVSDDSDSVNEEIFENNRNHVPYYYKNPNINKDFVYEKEDNIDTLDIVIILLFSLVPLIGLFYLLYTGFIQNNSIIKRKIARAVFLTYIFIFLMIGMFLFGLSLGLL